MASPSISLSLVAPSDDEPRYRAARALRYTVLRAPLGRPPGSEVFPFEREALHLVALDGDAVVGCVLFHPDGRGGGRLFQMAVRSDRRGQGLGRRLVRALEERLRERGVERVNLHARVTVSRFYEKLGYVPQGPEYEEVGIPHVNMARRL